MTSTLLVAVALVGSASALSTAPVRAVRPSSVVARMSHEGMPRRAMSHEGMPRRAALRSAVLAATIFTVAPAHSDPVPESINLLNPKVEFDGPLMADPASAAKRLYAKNKAAEAASMAAAENRAAAAKSAEEAAKDFVLDKEARVEAAKAKRAAEKEAFLAKRGQ